MITPNLTLVYDRKKVTTKDKTKKGVVELKISAGKVRKYISTGMKLLPKEWKNGAVTGREDMLDLNRQLQSLVKKCSKIITEMMEEDEIDLNAIPSVLKSKLSQKQTFLEYAKDSAEQKMSSLRIGTQKRYKVVFDFLDRWKGIVYFADLTEQNIRKMDKYLEERGLKPGSRYNYHKIVKIFVLQAFADGIIKHNPYGKVKIKRGDENGKARVLTPEEFHRLETCIIPTEKERKVRDLFVFQTYTMMGYADLKEFDYDSCVKVGGHIMYKANRQKTGQEFTFMLLDQAIKILKKYDYKLPIISIENYNAYLKVVAGYAQIDKPLTTHYARHTGATLLLNEGSVPMHVIQRILGHASIRETERTYAKVLDRTIVEQMAEYQSKNRKRALK